MIPKTGILWTIGWEVAFIVLFLLLAKVVPLPLALGGLIVAALIDWLAAPVRRAEEPEQAA